MTTTTPATITIAWLRTVEHVDPYGRRTQREPEVSAVVWTLRGDKQDYERAREYTESIEADLVRVYVYPTNEQEPLSRARTRVLEEHDARTIHRELGRCTGMGAQTLADAIGLPLARVEALLPRVASPRRRASGRVVWQAKNPFRLE